MAGINLSGILYIYRARLQAKAVLMQECFAILGIAVGVALLFASQIASASLNHSVAQLSSQLVGNAQVQLQARGPEGFRQALLEEVKDAPGVTAALPVFDRQMNIIGPHGGERSIDLIGVDPSTVRASSPLLRRFSARQLSAQHAVALPAQLASEIGAGPLETVKLQVGASYVETLVGTTLNEADIGELANSPVAVATLRYAQRLTGAQGRLSRIFVRYDPARAHEAQTALARLAAKWNVNLLPGKFDARLFAVAVSPESQSETLFSGISALVGFMFALNAMLITVPARRALINEIRPQGASRWDTAKILMFDAVVIGGAACVLGLVLGDLLSLAVFHSTPGYLTVAFPIGNNRIVTWQSAALAVAAGMTAAIMGVFWPLREILSRPLLVTPRHPKSRRLSSTTIRCFVGIACLAITTTTLIVDTKAAILGNVTLVAALVVLLPLLFDAIVQLFERLSTALDDVGSALAVTELQTPQTRVRSLAIAATAAVAVFGVVEFHGTQANLEKGIDSASRATDSTADIWVLPKGKTSIQATTPFAVVNTSALAHLPGVSAVSVLRGSFLNWGDRRLWVFAPAAIAEHPVPVSQVVSGDPGLASEQVREGGWAVISQALAAEHHLHVGQVFTLPAPRPLKLHVAALTTNLGWPPGAVILNSATYAHAWASDDPSAYTIQIAAGASPAAVRNRVRQALDSIPGLVVETAKERELRHYAVAAQGLSRLTQIRILVLIAAILAVVGAMGAMIWQRRDLIAYIKVQGYQERVLRRWLLFEAAVLLVAGCSMGAIFGLYAQLLGSHFLATVTGFPIVFEVEAFAAISSFAIVSIIALAVVALPGYLVVRVPPNIAAKPTY